MNWPIYFFLAPVLAAQQIVPLSYAPAAVAGRVINGSTGQPVRKASVSLEFTGDRLTSQLLATTDESGAFRFAGLSAGTYKLAAEKNGLLGGGYGQLKLEDSDSLLKLAAADRINDIVLRLFPAATIAGRVLDGDGDPVPDAEVVLWNRHRSHGAVTESQAGGATTNDAGEYTLTGLSKGTYLVSASSPVRSSSVPQIPVDSSGNPTKIHDLTTFYPAAVSIADAQGLSVDSGQDRLGINISLQRGPTVSVKGRIAGAFTSPSRYRVVSSTDHGMGPGVEEAKISPSGDFVFDPFAPGKRHISLLQMGPNGLHTIGETEATVADQDISGVTITPFKPAHVRAKVVIEGEEENPLTNGSFFLTPSQPDGGGANSQSAFLPQNGTYALDVAPGRYTVWFNDAPGCYLKSVQSGNRTLNPASIEIADGAVTDLLVTFSKNVASLSGNVELAQDQSPHSVHVLLIAEEAQTPWGAKVRSLPLDQSLHFSINHLPPGNYHAFAAEEDDSELWEDPDFVKLLLDRGAPLELHEKEQSTVHLKLIPKQETNRIRQQLGI